jgi:hypothetical protein
LNLICPGELPYVLTNFGWEVEEVEWVVGLYFGELFSCSLLAIRDLAILEVAVGVRSEYPARERFGMVEGERFFKGASVLSGLFETIEHW